MHNAKLGQIPSICSHDIELMRNDPKLDVVNINASAKFGLIPTISSYAMY